MKKTVLLLATLLLFISSIQAQTLALEIEEHRFQVDPLNNLILSHLDDIATYGDLSEFSDITIQLDGETYLFETMPERLQFTASYRVGDGTNSYTLYFTPLPIIALDSDVEIVDEPKVLGSFSYADYEEIITSNIGIEVRGGVSQTYPKKTYDLEFWEDTTGEDTDNVQFGTLRSDDDWILDGLYNEPLRLRSNMAHNLWVEMNSLYYQEDEDEAVSGARVQFVEVFLKGVYNGIYNLSEQVDRKQLKLKKYNEEDGIRGELYKGNSHGPVVDFTGVPDYDNESRFWGGQEMKYPDDDDITEWLNLSQFVDFVVNSDDATFSTDIWNRFQRDNANDYFIFLNLLRATDNRGKNIYTARYKADEPYFYVPWDLDGVFGTKYTGENMDITDDILVNGMFERMLELNPNGNLSTMSMRWFSLRENTLSLEQLEGKILSSYTLLQDNKIYEREALMYDNFDYDEISLYYMRIWIEERLDFLDEYFGEFLSVGDAELATINSYLYPNPASSEVFVESAQPLSNVPFSIYDTLGRKVHSAVLENNRIPLSQLSSGLYIVHIQTKSFKLIIK